jgi:hypothetical protein
MLMVRFFRLRPLVLLQGAKLRMPPKQRKAAAKRASSAAALARAVKNEVPNTRTTQSWLTLQRGRMPPPSRMQPNLSPCEGRMDSDPPFSRHYIPYHAHNSKLTTTDPEHRTTALLAPTACLTSHMLSPRGRGETASEFGGRGSCKGHIFTTLMHSQAVTQTVFPVRPLSQSA